ncbi:DUF2617 family protein [Pseudonocardia sp. DSM 110487]|uniref:DUF2617 family protein n=1 Tax=Pseudonocardia sp. DSM 110487 TaxID=2865833 RepID=UPI001C695C39|nr:DUF2617 family protein [Pseudonocardia sp. DSM 110487]QYN35974.1 DUF2617 family protein [Pseudonocardia sp. DSM 110487]
MSLHHLDVEPRDVAAEALGLLLDAPAPAALAELVLDDGRGGRLVLGVLGASHVVTAGSGGHVLTEQVSCDALAAGGRALPERAESDGYTLSSTVTPVPRADLDATAVRLRARAERDDRLLCGAFPGDAGALTALAAAPLPGGGWTWETWHLYPGAERGVIVTTRSRWAR